MALCVLTHQVIQDYSKGFEQYRLKTAVSTTLTVLYISIYNTVKA